MKPARVPEDDYGETALMFAAANNRVEAIKVLLAHGASSSVTTKVLDIAGHFRVVAVRNDWGCGIRGLAGALMSRV